MLQILSPGEIEYLESIIDDKPLGSQERAELEDYLSDCDELKFWAKREANYHD